MMKINTKKLVMAALLLALSVVGAQIKIFGSIAFDSAPAFMAAIFISPLIGGVIGLLGHLMSAATSGFMFTIPIHLVIGVMMFVSCYAFGIAYQKINAFTGILVGLILNGPISLAVTALAMFSMMGIPVMGIILSPGIENTWVTVPLVLVLSIAALLNILIAHLMYVKLKDLHFLQEIH